MYGNFDRECCWHVIGLVRNFDLDGVRLRREMRNGACTLSLQGVS
jgi:hypothetical protein